MKYSLGTIIARSDIGGAVIQMPTGDYYAKRCSSGIFRIALDLKNAQEMMNKKGSKGVQLRFI
jgi:hypothetical protein